MEYPRRRNLNAAPWIGDGSAEPTYRNHRFVVISDLDKLNRTWTLSECEKSLRSNPNPFLLVLGDE